ncbi:Peptidoglycan deacetylase [Colletotrichum sp. SAR 10_86]|nr:Peptidoglycan deacetylase [Colletotrichum sp. SAR 10_86]KAJ5002360.1 Peptidoglycan deacetylase [Colletotrichum sp. SAR 10_66]
MAPKALCCFSVDIDAVCGWIGSYGGEESVSDISRGYFAGTVGVRRLLDLFKKYNIKTTWFIPGHTLETFPEECALIRDAGHEIGLHGYSHENPKEMTVEQQRVVLDKTYRLVTEFCGKPPRGSVVPWWETPKAGAELMLEYDTWMKPLVRGEETGLVEIPASWYLDDLPPMMFIKNMQNSHGCVHPSVVEDLWKDHFDFFYENYDNFCFPVTIHPDVSGHPHAIKMLER